MKIAGQEIKDPQVAAALAKLKSAGREELGDDEVQNESQAAALLSHIADEVVYSPSSQDRKFTWGDYTTLAREFQARFSPAQSKAGFAGVNRFASCLEAGFGRGECSFEEVGSGALREVGPPP
ncbi:MAG TPA: hypothetical protein VFX30_04440 [bacterium]|nr:hypothetical protein [bacterium]